MSVEKIDLVYLWVDGGDENWRAEKERWLCKIKGETHVPRDAAVAARWRDNDEFRYSLRSVEKFAPWINRIYIITGFGQIPKWLSPHPKIAIVPHGDIMPPDALPTFNATAIEMCMANIPELSEHFLLANDDMFFGRPVSPDFFFDKRGRAIVWYGTRKYGRKNIGLILEGQEQYDQTILMTAKFIADIYGRDFRRMRPAHNIDPYLKSSVIAAKNHPMIFRQIDGQIRNKFRTVWEVQRWYFNLCDLAHGKSVFMRARKKKNMTESFFARKYSDLYNFIYRRSIKNSPQYCTDAKAAAIALTRPPLFCINDTDDATDEMRRSNRGFLSEMFPEKSSFEK